MSGWIGDRKIHLGAVSPEILDIILDPLQSQNLIPQVLQTNIEKLG